MQQPLPSELAEARLLDLLDAASEASGLALSAIQVVRLRRSLVEAAVTAGVVVVSVEEIEHATG